MAYTTAEGRQRLLDTVAEATDDIARALALLGAAYEALDEDTGDALEGALFRPVQSAYGQAQRTHGEFAARYGLSARRFSPAPSPTGQHGARELIEDGIDAVQAADEAIIELQDSLLPVEVGDPPLRAGLAQIREVLEALPQRAEELLRTLGR
jgi:hypothetical protein